MPWETLLKEETQGKQGNKGILIKGGFKKSDRSSSLVQLLLEVTNKSAQTLNDFVIQMKPS